MLKEDKKLLILSNIRYKLSESKGIALYEYELLNQIKSEQKNDINDYNQKDGQENNSNEQKIENRINQEKIKLNIEKILSYIKDKKEYEFISDYFINEVDNSNSIINNSKDIKIEKNEINDINNLDIINEEYLSLLSKENFSEIGSIIKFNEKFNKEKSDKLLPSLSFNPKKNIIKEEDILLPHIEKAKSFSSSKNEDMPSKEEMDKELEEEINRQIFGYTKRMKESAKNFGVQLRKDNQTLNKIESLQDKVNDKTQTQVKRLKEFNYSLKIGFCKLLFLMLSVFGTFILTLFIIKIFPKLA